MKHNLSLEADSYLAGQQTPRIFFPQVHYRVLDPATLFNFFVSTSSFLHLALHYTLPWSEYGRNIYFKQVH
jgi:hypothetical protein